ncbi:MAG TPA: carboxymuconolactone decarboxylase family protein [Gammaproteobacteria bacterium]|nr:carboxymuconolactone decarboxylase family protein [Gammaproteobacteria bacterium]
MTRFDVYTPITAPAGSQQMLSEVQQAFGFLPNLYGVIAESPTALKAAISMGDAYRTGSLSAAEQQVVLLAVSVENRCEFCTAAHSFTARHIGKLPDADVQALRQGRNPADSRLATLAHFTRLVVSRRGWVPEAELEAFLAVGYTRAQVIEVILGVAMKTLHNYIDHLAHTPLNPQFQPERWSPEQVAA